jgi:hypothetical protein
MSFKNAKISTVVSAVLFVFSGLYFLQSLQYIYWQGYSPASGFAPRWVSGLCAVFCAVSTIQSLKKDGIPLKDLFPKGEGRKNLIIFWVTLFFFVFLAPVFGFFISSLALLTALFKLGVSKWRKALLYSIILTACCYVVFEVLLNVPLPVNRLGW